MILGSHNSWTYLSPKKWYLKPFKFIAKCQDLSIIEQYEAGVRCFDLRVRFSDGELKVCHGIFEYNISRKSLYDDLNWLNSKGDVCIRLIHETRNRRQYSCSSIESFKQFCSYVLTIYDKIKFWCGRNLYNWNFDFNFDFNPTCEDKYSSVCSPKLIDDWYPRLYAYFNNKRIVEKGTDKDILLIDFVSYGN